MTINKRKALSKKLRFEVFKRDSFTCQYCGKAAPEVILHIDHINPVKHGGKNDILNLITSCQECNLGKSSTKLSDNTVVSKQKEQLDLLNEKRLQLKLLMQWKDELLEIENEQIEYIGSKFSDLTKNQRSFTETGLANIRKHIDKYGFNEVLESLVIACKQYFVWDKNGKLTDESVNKAVDYISRICFSRKLQKDNPELGELRYINGIAHNRFQFHNKEKGLELLKETYNKGYTLDALKDFTLRCKNWSEWKSGLINAEPVDDDEDDEEE